MEDIKQPHQQTQPPVMDIQPPQVAPNEQPVSAPTPAAPPVPEEPAPASAQSTETAAAGETPAQATPALAAVASAHKPRRMPMIAIVCAVLFTGIFAAVAVVAYMSKSNVKTTDSSQQPATNATSEPPATAADVTDTDKAIDDSMSSVDDAADYNDAGVSDTTLGL